MKKTPNATKEQTNSQNKTYKNINWTKGTNQNAFKDIRTPGWKEEPAPKVAPVFLQMIKTNSDTSLI